MTIKKGTSTIATGSSVEWGGVEGTLADQTDLKNALDAKAPTLSPAFTGAPTAPTAEEGTNTTQIATTAFVKNAVDNIDALPDQTDMAGKYLATDGLNAYWKSPAGLPLLSFIWSDHLLNDASFLRADTFSWQSGLVYKSAYQHLIADIDGINTTTETVGSYTITYYPCADGHKIVPANQEETVQDIYAETGIGWYYILDTTNNRFKLPRTKWGFVGYRNEVGKYVPESLPNVKGSAGFDYGTNSCGPYTCSGAFISGSTKTGRPANYDSNTAIGNLIFNASNSSSTYQDNAPVQERATEMYLYFYVGNTIRNETEIDVGEITEALDGKLDQDLSNASANFKETIDSWGMPDYSSGVAKSDNTDYTATTNGWLEIFSSNYNSAVAATLTINGTTKVINLAATSSHLNCTYVFVPIPKNSTYKVVFQRTLSDQYINFYPCVGG